MQQVQRYLRTMPIGGSVPDIGAARWRPEYLALVLAACACFCVSYPNRLAPVATAAATNLDARNLITLADAAIEALQERRKALTNQQLTTDLQLLLLFLEHAR